MSVHAASVASFASIPTVVADRPEAALAHGVHLARRLESRLEVAHVVDAPTGFGPEMALSDVRGVLRRWRARDVSAQPVDYHQFVWSGAEDPSRDDTFLNSLADVRAEMIVVNRQEGFDRGGSGVRMAAGIAQRARIPVLMVGDEDIVDPLDGQGRVRRVLVPVAGIRSAQVLAEAAVWFGQCFVDRPVQSVFVHLQAEASTLAMRPPVMADDSFQFTTRTGPVVQALVAEAIERRVDAVLLPLGIEIGGGGAILDTATIEELARRLPMPIMTLPVRHRWKPGASEASSVRVIKVAPRRPANRGRINRLF